MRATHFLTQPPTHPQHTGPMMLRRLVAWVWTGISSAGPASNHRARILGSGAAAGAAVDSGGGSASGHGPPPLPGAAPTAGPAIATGRGLSPLFLSAQPSSSSSSSSSLAAASSLVDLHEVVVSSNRGQQRLRVHVLPRDSAALDALLDMLHARAVARGGAVLGMDAEWQPELSKFEHNPVALLQLAWEEDVFLLRLQHMRGEMPPALHRLMADESIVKVGCAVASDAKRLFIDYGLETRAHLDLREIMAGLGLLHAKKRSLSWLAREFVGVTLDKTMQISDWGTPHELTPDQITYSAIDAWVAGSIVDCLYRRYKDQVGQPPCVTSFARRLFPRGKQGAPSTPGKKARKKGSRAMTTAAASADAAVAGSGPSGNVTALLTTRGGGGGGGGVGLSTGGVVGETVSGGSGSSKMKLKCGGHLPRSSPLYDNWRMVAPDGALLCTCSRKKAQWYLDRGMAELVEDGDGEVGPSRRTIRLLFEPRGREEDPAALSEKVDRCVGCGCEEGLVRHHIVPTAYKKHFPAQFKDHLCHDVVLLCLPCHLRYNTAMQHRMGELAAQHLPPTAIGTASASTLDTPVLRDPALDRVRKAGAALLKHGPHLPPAKRAEFEAIVSGHFGGTLDVAAAVALDPRVPNLEYVPEGKRVIDALLAGGAAQDDDDDAVLGEFVRAWRRHFVGCLPSTEFLPAYFSVDYRVRSSLRGPLARRRAGGEEEEGGGRAVCLTGAGPQARN